MVKNRGCASTGEMLSAVSKRKAGKVVQKRGEAPGPKYSGKLSGKNKRAPLARTATSSRIPYRVFAGLRPTDRCRVGVKLGLLPKLEGTKHSLCGTKLTLKDVGESKGRSAALSLESFGCVNAVPTLCRYFCKDRTCIGMKVGVPVQSEDGSAIQLGGRGKAPAGEGLLMVCLACQPFAQKYASVNDAGLLQGISHSSTQLYLDEVRAMQAKLNITEQSKIKFTSGMLTEIDETGVRAVRVKCSAPCHECGPDCEGYRLEWNRWLIIIERGNRRNMVVRQMPWKTSRAGGGGVPLSDAECDKLVPPYLSQGVVVFTDGASPYEALAAGDIKCSPNCTRKGCLDRASLNGGDKCSGWRPREGRDRFRQFYQKKKLSHGVVTHKKEEWAIINSVRVHTSTGSTKVIDLKHGTECADGTWAEMKQAIPPQVRSTDRERIATYVNAWAWRARRQGEDLFQAFATAVKKSV